MLQVEVHIECPFSIPKFLPKDTYKSFMSFTMLVMYSKELPIRNQIPIWEGEHSLSLALYGLFNIRVRTTILCISAPPTSVTDEVPCHVMTSRQLRFAIPALNAFILHVQRWFGTWVGLTQGIILRGLTVLLTTVNTHTKLIVISHTLYLQASDKNGFYIYMISKRVHVNL
jgi:hypothetical protein